MARDSHDAPPMSRFRAFTTSLGFKSSGLSRSSPDQSSTPQRPVSMSSIQSLYGNFTLYLRVHSARNLPAVAQGSYCKLYLGDTPIIGGFGHGKSLVGDNKQGNSHQTFHTKVQMSATKDCPEWNEKFQLNVQNPNTEILTIRVKNHVLLYSPAIGACVIHLRQLQLGETIDEWFPLYKNDKASGQIRLQICLQENVQMPVPERRYSQTSEETIQRLMKEHRELEEAQRRELEMQQQEKWKRMEEDAIKHAGLEQQIEREEKWRERKMEKQQEEHQNSDSELPQSFKNRGGKKDENSDSELPVSFKYRGVKKEENVATQMIEKLHLQENNGCGVNSGISSGYTVNADDFPDQPTTGFGTIRLSVDELNQVVQNALPTSESSGSTSSEYERRRRKAQDDRKQSRRKKHSKRQKYIDDESSDSSSASSRKYRKSSSRVKMSEKKTFKKSTQGSVSSRSESSHNQNQQEGDIPTTLTFPPSPSDGSPSSENERHHRRRRRAEKAKKKAKERKRRSKRKHKSRRNYESSYSSSSLSSSSSYLSSSEEERLRRKLKKKKSRKARARANLAESGESRASTQTSGISYPHKLSYAELRNIDSMSPYVAQQHWTPEQIDCVQGNGMQREGQASRPGHNGIVDDGDNAATPYATSAAQQQPVFHDYGPDGVAFDEPDQPAIPQYLGQTTKEQTNAELMRSFCF